MNAENTVTIPRLLGKYKEEIIDAMKQKFHYKNINEVPKLVKLIVNMGIGDAAREIKVVEELSRDMSMITGQKALITRARKSIAGFKVRQGNPVGCKVTLRRAKMYEFLDRFISVAVPRMKDFRGFSSNRFDGQGNYNFGIDEQSIFPEVNLDKMYKTQGMNITIVTTAKTDEEAEYLLRQFGFPFEREE